MSSYNLEDILNATNTAHEDNIKNRSKKYEEDPRVLSFKKNNKYIGRFIPNIHDLSKTFLPYEVVSFNSFSTEKYVFGGRSPKNAGFKKDLYSDAQWSTYEKANKLGDEILKKKSYSLIPKRMEMVNFLLLAVEGDDEEAKAKIGQVVVIKYAAQLNKDNTPRSEMYEKIYSGIHGDKKAKIGTRAFDLGEKGKSFVINVTEKGGWANYAKSEFDDAEDSGYDAKDVYPKAHNLEEFIPEVLSDESIKKILDDHFYCQEASPDDSMEPERSSARNLLDTLDESDDTDIPGIGGGDEDELDSILEGLTK